MPTKTTMLDNGGFVHSPDVPMSAAFAEYLHQIDHLLAACRDTTDRWSQAMFSAELLERKKNAERQYDDFAAAYRDKYTIKHVMRDPMFLPISRFFARYHPIRTPFAILHCSLDLPLHTVYAFENYPDLKIVNAALGETTPLRWWQNGPLNHPCYLFGKWIWELKPTELNASEMGLALLFEQTKEKDQLRRDRLRPNVSGSNGPLDQQYIPEAVRAAVWRRDDGKCARCGSREGVDFGILASAAPRDILAAKDVQLLCAVPREVSIGCEIAQFLGRDAPRQPWLQLMGTPAGYPCHEETAKRLATGR